MEQADRGRIHGGRSGRYAHDQSGTTRRVEDRETATSSCCEGDRVHVRQRSVRRFVDDNEWVLEVWMRQRGSWRVVATQVNFVDR
jgi:hypothetical protein